MGLSIVTYSTVQKKVDIRKSTSKRHGKGSSQQASDRY